MYTFSSSLHTPDDTTWKASLGYSPTIAEALCDAYNVIRRGMGSVNAFEHAAAIVAPHLKARMSQRQRIRLYFVQAVACAACDHFEDAIDWTDWGIDLAAQLDDMAAQCGSLPFVPPVIAHFCGLLMPSPIAVPVRPARHSARCRRGG